MDSKIQLRGTINRTNASQSFIEHGLCVNNAEKMDAERYRNRKCV